MRKAWIWQDHKDAFFFLSSDIRNLSIETYLIRLLRDLQGFQSGPVYCSRCVYQKADWGNNECSICAVIFFSKILKLLSNWNFLRSLRASGQEKNGYFTVRLTVSVYPPPPPKPHHHPRLRSAFREFFLVCYTRKKSFSSNSKNHHSFLLLAAALSENGRIALRTWKIHFRDPSQRDWVSENQILKKNGSKFSAWP